MQYALSFDSLNSIWIYKICIYEANRVPTSVQFLNRSLVFDIKNYF